jgi:hypothetical protein
MSVKPPSIKTRTPKQDDDFNWIWDSIEKLKKLVATEGMGRLRSSNIEREKRLKELIKKANKDE